MFDLSDTGLIDRPGPGAVNSGRAGRTGGEFVGAGLGHPVIGVPAAVRPTARRGIAFVQLHDDLWRVTRSDGEVLGYVESFLEPRGRRYRSKRFLPLQKRFLVLGEFWGLDDAVDCLRFG
jgi:hypothetical protein